MTVSHRNASDSYLAAMGIDRWQRRSLIEPRAGIDNELTQDAPASTDAGDTASLSWSMLEDTVSHCARCSLHQTRRTTVFGTGSTSASWMFVGEAPGAEEDRQGLPFVGRAGQLLDAMLTACGLSRESVYIANVLKCRPPDNRDPQGEEVVQCEPYLHRQVALVQPRVIVALGRFAAQSLLHSSLPISRLRGDTHSYADTGIPLVVTYHPAYLLRSPRDKGNAWRDLCLAQDVVQRSMR